MRRDWAICAGLVIITVSAYWSVDQFGFLSPEDLVVSANRYVRDGLSEDGMRWAFTTTETGAWQPLTWLSHMLDVQIFGLRGKSHHVVSVGFHLANAVVLFLLLLRMTDAPWRSTLVAALFAVHPLHVESVAWVAARGNVLGVFLGLLVITAYVGYASRPGLPRYALIFALLALGLMAGPMLMTLPLVLLLLDYWPLGRFHRDPMVRPVPAQGAKEEWKSAREQKRKAAAESLPPSPGRIAAGLVVEKLPLLALAVAASVAAFVIRFRGGGTSLAESLPFGSRAANALTACVGYLGKTLWPVNLTLYYPFDVDHVMRWAVPAGLLLAAITGAVLWAARRGRRYLAVGWLWYLVTLLPLLGLVRLGGQAMADRYAYLPGVGLLLMAVWGAADLLAAWQRGRAVLVAGGAAAVVVCFVLTIQQVGHWRNTGTLLEHAAAIYPDNSMVHNRLGTYYWMQYTRADQEKEQEEAEANLDSMARHAQLALQAREGDTTALRQLSLVCMTRKQWDEALKHLDTALLTAPSDAGVHYQYGKVLLQGRNDIDGAAQRFREAIRLNPDHPQAHADLAMLYLNTGKPDLAAGEWREALRCMPDHPGAMRGLGTALIAQGKYLEALQLLRPYLDRYPDNFAVRKALAFVLTQTGTTREVLDQWREILRTEPKDIEALNAVAWIQATSPDASLRNGAEAVERAQQALGLAKDDHPGLLDTLAAAYAEAGRFREAFQTARWAKTQAAARGQAELARKIQDRMDLYRANTPYREAPVMSRR